MNLPLEIEVDQLQALLASEAPPLVVDVREPWEQDICRLEPSELVPLDQITRKMTAFPREREIVLYCHHGIRSLQAAEFLRRNGFRVCSLRGGIAEWSRRVDPEMPTY
ncbi:MAG: rhodanese-like domain-containing protein [Acidobacteriota bacterium]